MKKIKFLIAFLIVLLNTSYLFAQQNHVFKNLYLVYVDYSNVTGSEGFSLGVIDSLKNNFNKISKDTSARFLLYISNGRKFQTTGKVSEANDKISSLGAYGSNNFPDNLIDKEELRQQLFTKSFIISQSVNCFFYLSNSFCKQLASNSEILTDENSYFMSSLISDIEYLTDYSNKKINIFITYSKGVKNINEHSLEKSLLFYLPKNELEKFNIKINSI